jgi:hypothetical protein
VESEVPPSPRLIEQRIRNRIIEYLELASSFEAQSTLDATTIAHVPNEVINEWDDWNPVDQSRWPGRLGEPYSDAEIAAMQTFHAEWEWVLDHTPDPLPALSDLQQAPEWQRLREAAEAALRPFNARGRLSEDHEV